MRKSNWSMRSPGKGVEIKKICELPTPRKKLLQHFMRIMFQEFQSSTSLPQMQGMHAYQQTRCCLYSQLFLKDDSFPRQMQARFRVHDGTGGEVQ